MRSFALAALLAATAALPGHAEGLTDMSEAERAAFREEVRAYLIENPEVIVEAMTALQMKEDEMALQQDLQLLAENKPAIFESEHDWAGGNLDGDVVLVEFMDYRCGYCHKAYADVEELVKTDGKIRFVLKEFPILGDQSVLSSKFAIAVRQLYGDDAYKAAHDALFAFRGDFTPDTLSRLASDLGHVPADVLAKMEAPEVQAVIDANYALAEALQVNGTPTFALGETLVRGYVPLDAMQGMVKRQREG